MFFTICKNCGAQMNLTDKVCPNCGAKSEFADATEDLDTEELFTGHSKQRYTHVSAAGESSVLGILSIAFGFCVNWP